MRTLIQAVLACMVVASAPGAERPEQGQVKAMELYSWQARGQWVFVLANANNRLRTELEVRASPDRIESLAVLRNRFKTLADGERVNWNPRFPRSFSFPEKPIFDAVMAAARDSGVDLRPVVPERK